MAWIFIPGYEGIYMVSDRGQIKSFKRRKTQVLKPCLDTHGYPHISLYKNKQRKRFLIHRLVLAAFCGNRFYGAECRHLDGNPQNNTLDNLQWGTHSENMIDRNRHGTMRSMRGSKNNNAKLNECQVRIIKRLLCICGWTQKEIGNIFGVSPDVIGSIKRGKVWVS